MNQITKNRVIDADLIRRQINEGKLHVCEKHFEEKFIEKRKYCHCCKLYMKCNDICIFMRQLWVSLGLFSRAVRSHESSCLRTQ